jgi:HAD superfamily hydrolase (TIGR01509 family)
MSASPSGVLMDLDGTLTDTNYLHAIAWSRALDDLGEWAPMNAIHRLVGMGADQLVPELLGHSLEGAEDAWRAHYDELVGDIRVFPGAAELLQRLHAAGLAVVIATSSPSDLVERALDLLGAGDVIDAVTTSDDVAASKPDPAVFLAGLQAGSIDPHRALAVGDSIWDVRAARLAGLACITVETGGFSRHELSEEGAVAVYRDAAELSAQLATSPIALLASQSPLTESRSVRA